MSLELPTAKFQAAMLEYAAATKKDAVQILNRGLRNIGYQAARFTPKKDPSTIEAELRKDKIGLKIATKQLTSRKGKKYTTKKGKTRTVKRVTRKQIALRTRQLINRRKKRTGFLRAGWVAALIAAGLTAPGGKVLIKDGKSKIGSGQQATPSRLFAYLGNGVYGRLNGKSAAKIRRAMELALARGMRYVAADMTRFARDKMSGTASKFSARKGSTKSVSSQINSVLKGL